MMRLSIFSTFLVSGALLTGCASLSKEECLRNDWAAIGFRDGTEGYAMKRIHEHEEACRAYHIVPDLAAYQAGRDRGLIHYCTEANGFHEGEQGVAYQRVCPTAREDRFIHGYRRGLDSARRNVELDMQMKTVELLRKTSEVARIDDKEKRERELKSLDQLESELQSLQSTHKNLIQLLQRVHHF
jgi:hypothetical protein